MKTHLTSFIKKTLLPFLILVFFLFNFQISLLSQGFFGDPVENPFGITITPSEGNNSYPVLVDIDGDSDLDLFISHREYTAPCWVVNGFEYYENNGTGDTPMFMKHDTVPFGINPNTVAAQFVDIDNDGDQDLFKINHCFVPIIELYLNDGTATNPKFNESPDEIIDLSEYSYPFASLTFGDLDNDGDFDAMVNGIHPAAFTYLKNVGTPEAYNFAPAETNPYGLEIPFVDGSEGAYFVDWDCDGDMDIFNTHILISTGHDPTLYYHENDGTPENPSFLEPVLAKEDVFVSTMGDIDGDGDKDLFADEYYFENITNIPACTISGVVEPLGKYFKVYPNPAIDYIFLEWHSLESISDARIVLYDVLGRQLKIIENEFLESGSALKITTSEFPKGTYLLKVSFGDNILTQQFNKQ